MTKYVVNKYDYDNYGITIDDCEYNNIKCTYLKIEIETPCVDVNFILNKAEGEKFIKTLQEALNNIS